MVGHFLKWLAQAYQTNHSWHLGSILFLHTDTDTCMHICILTADYTVKPVLRGHLKKEHQISLNAGQKYCRMLKGILQSFWPSLNYHLLLRSLFCLILSGCLRHVLLYWQLFCGVCRLAVRWIFFIKVRFFSNKKDGSTGPTALESYGPYFEIMGQCPGPTINLKACYSMKISSASQVT